MLAKNSPVNYKSPRYIGGEPEMLQVDKLLPYQADSGEQFHSWLKDEKLGGYAIAGTHTERPVPPEYSYGQDEGPLPEVNGYPHDLHPEVSADIKSEKKRLLHIVCHHATRLMSCQQPDRYVAMHSIGSGCPTASDVVTSLFVLVGPLLGISLAPPIDTVVASSLAPTWISRYPSQH